MSYKLIGEHEDKYELMHPNGNTFYVAKKGVNKKVIEHIKSLGSVNQYADGGMVSSMDEEMPISSEMPSQKPVDPTIGMQQATPERRLFEQERERFRSGNVNMPPEVIDKMALDATSMALEKKDLAEKNAAFIEKSAAQKKYQEDMDYNAKAARIGLPLRPVQDPAQTPSQVSMPQAQEQKQELPLETQQPQPQIQDQYGSAIGMIEQGMAGVAREQANLAKQQAETLQKLQQDIVTAQDIHKKSQEAKMKELEEFQAAASKDIDPNRLWGNMATGNKIGASIAILLGGIGAGLTGRENAALSVIDSAIRNDIEAQKQNVANKMSLYSKNLEKYKSADEAFKQTQLQLVSMADLKLKQAEQTAKSNEAKAALQTARGELRLKYAPIIEELSQKSTQRQVMKMAQINPEKVTPELAQLLPEKDRERYVPGLGFALTEKGASIIRNEIKPQRDDVVVAIDRLKNIRKEYGREITNREAVAEADTIKSILRGQLRTFLVGPGAVSESEWKVLEDVIADPTSIMSMDSSVQKRLDTLKNSVERSYVNKAQAQGLQPRQAESGSGQIQLRNGIPYQKVPGGWVPLRTGK